MLSGIAAWFTEVMFSFHLLALGCNTSVWKQETGASVQKEIMSWDLVHTHYRCSLWHTNQICVISEIERREEEVPGPSQLYF